MENVTFEDVVVNNPALLDTDYHTCEAVSSGVATGTTRPNPNPNPYSSLTLTLTRTPTVP